MDAVGHSPFPIDISIRGRRSRYFLYSLGAVPHVGPDRSDIKSPTWDYMAILISSNRAHAYEYLWSQK
jgi:hypothetical protein